MPRKSKIDQLGLGPKVVAYAQTGLSQDAIIRRIKAEHDADLSPNNVSWYLKHHSSNICSRPPSPQVVAEITAATFTDALKGAINEAKSKYEELKDDPKAGWAWFKHYLETLDRMGKVVGAYQPEHQVNVQVNNIVSKEAFEKSLKDSEEYFESLERVGGEHAV